MALSSGNGGATITGALLRAMGTTLGQIENAPLVLKPVVLTHIFDSPEELSRMLLVHYRGQVRWLARSMEYCYPVKSGDGTAFRGLAWYDLGREGR